jgi:glycosyltransferase EpsF
MAFNKTGNKTHVLQIVGTMNRGGAEVMLMDIFRNLSENTKFSFLINYKVKTGIVKGDFDDEILNKGADIKYIGTQWDLGPLKYIKEFKRIYNELGKPEVVHIHLNAKSGIIALAAKLAGAKKIIVHSHADLKFRGSLFHVLISRLELQMQKILINKYATDFWGASKEANASLFYKKQQHKTVVINNAVYTNKFQKVNKQEINEFKDSLNIKNDTLILGNVGRIVRHKNIGFILDVLNEYHKTNTNFVFLFAGRIDDRRYFEEIQAKIKQYKLEDKVIHLGNRDDVPTIINSMDVFIAPALKEGFGLVAVEAQAAGIPCLLYKGFPKSVDMGLNLVSFMNDFNIKKWQMEIDKIKHHRLANKKLIKNTIREKGFDIKDNTQTIEKLYNQ